MCRRCRWVWYSTFTRCPLVDVINKTAQWRIFRVWNETFDIRPISHVVRTFIFRLSYDVIGTIKDCILTKHWPYQCFFWCSQNPLILYIFKNWNSQLGDWGIGGGQVGCNYFLPISILTLSLRGGGLNHTICLNYFLIEYWRIFLCVEIFVPLKFQYNFFIPLELSRLFFIPLKNAPANSALDKCPSP